MRALDQLTDIIAQGEQLDGKFKSDRRNMDFYCLAEDEIFVVEGERQRGQAGFPPKASARLNSRTRLKE